MNNNEVLSICSFIDLFPCYLCIYLFIYLFARGDHLYFRLDIIRVKGLSKHTLNTYFSGMKIDPKYAFLHAFFFNLSVMSIPKFVI